VERVNWYDALVFSNKLSMSENLSPAYSIKGSTDPADWGTNPADIWGGDPAWDAVVIEEGSTGYRLPTEAQWEYACSAGTETPFNTGDNITTAQANYDGNYPYNDNPKGTFRERTTEVGNFAPNAWDLYDMHGNVFEWCWDLYGDYESGTQTDPTGAVSGYYRVDRGGSWFHIGLVSRSAFRGHMGPHGKDDSIGFRLVLPNS
jgi:formylglycine-generating enzyme required for sulfatase activity